MLSFRHWITLGLACLLSQAYGCALYPYRVEVEHPATAGFEGVKKLVVETRNGSIEVRCDPNRKDVDIQAVKSACGFSEEDARTIAEAINIEVGRDPAESWVLRVAAKFPPADLARNQSARFRITLPPDAELALDTSNGRVTAEGCAKDVRINTSNGRITVTDCRGTLDARTSNGPVTARDVAGDVDVQTTNGRIELERVGRNLVKARTSNGRIRVMDAIGEAQVRTSNGSVELRCRSVSSAPHIQVVTSNGHVEVEVPRTINAELEMSTSNGRVHADFQDVRVSDFDSSRSRLRARLNDGGGSIDLESSNGSITLRAVGDAVIAKPAAKQS
jgi:DUF4097 and DUF4098 domain-containing protein YvlB